MNEKIMRERLTALPAVRHRQEGLWTASIVATSSVIHYAEVLSATPELAEEIAAKFVKQWNASDDLADAELIAAAKQLLRAIPKTTRVLRVSRAMRERLKAAVAAKEA